MSSVPLTQAVTSGDASAVSTVLANGADVNERTGGGQTPLILATIFGHTHLLHLLLDAGADPQLRDNLGLNAVDWAQRRGATEAIEVLTNKPRPRSSIERPVETRSTTLVRQAPPRERDTNEHKSTSQPQPFTEPKPISAEERSQRWLAGLKQRISELPQHDVSAQSNIFMRQPEPPPEIPEVPKPSPEIPELPTPQPEIPTPGPDIPELPKPGRDIPDLPKPGRDVPEPGTPELPGTPPELPKPVSPLPPQPQPEHPSQPPITEPPPTEPPITEPPVARRTRAVEATPPRVISIPLVPDLSTIEPRVAEPSTHEPEPQATRPRSGRKRCPKCGAIYNSELVAYCAHHYVALVSADEPPIISDPSKTSPVMFWMIIVITLTGSIVVGSIITAYFYGSTRAETQTASSSPPSATPVQKGIPIVDPELEGKVASLPIAECPLNGQEAIPGTVVVRVIIDRTGQVKSARATGGDWLLRGAASEAALKSTFAPEKLRSRETEGTITYTFEP